MSDNMTPHAKLLVLSCREFCVLLNLINLTQEPCIARYHTVKPTLFLLVNMVKKQNKNKK